MFRLIMNQSVSFCVAAIVLALSMAGCSGPDSTQRKQAAALAEKKVPTVEAGNFDKTVLKSAVPVLIWFYSSNGYTGYFDGQHQVMESIADHYGDRLAVVKIDHGKYPQIKWTMDPNDPEPWSRHSGSGVWLLRFSDGKIARFRMVNRETGTSNVPTLEQFVWFIDHAAAAAPLTTGGGVRTELSNGQ